jgi:hypothetical protein
MKLSLVTFSFSILVLVICLSDKLRAQTTTSGGLTGVVSDPSHAAVSDAVVEIRDNTKGTNQTAKTDSDGVYRFFFVAPGSYTLIVSHSGFHEEMQDINVLLGPAGTRNVTLKVEGTTATVKVTDEVPLLQAENGDVSTTVNRQQITEVPNPGNDLTYIAQTAPGAIMNTDTIGVGYSGNVSILGMPGTSNLFTINGINNNNIGGNVNNSGVTGMMLGLNEVQEATIVSDGYSGQFGGAAGSNINYLTKSGSNAFHGNALYYWNGNVLNANDWFDNAQGNPKPFDIAHQWAGSLGGPIKKEKLFFFFNAEGIRVLLPIQNQVVLPSAKFETATMANIDSVFGARSASHDFYRRVFDLYDKTPGASAATPGTFTSGDLGCNGWQGPQGLGTTDSCAVHFLENITAPSNDSLVSGRVDWNLAASDRVFLLVQYNFGNRARYVDAISPAFNAFSTQSAWQGQLSATHTFSPTAANQFLLAGTYIYGVTGLADSAKTQSVFPNDLNWWNEGNTFASVGGLDFAYGYPSWSGTTNFQISDDLVKTRGKHKLGFGVSFLRTYGTIQSYGWSGVGQLLPQTVDAFYWGGLDPDPLKQKTNYSTLDQTFPPVTGNRTAYYSLGLYAQEEWHALSNLKLTVALRADHQSNPVCASRCFTRLTGPFDSISHDPAQPYIQAILLHQEQAFANTDNINWSPRFGFAWQPLGVSRNTVIRGGIGIFYDPIAGGIGVGLAFNPPLSSTYVITGYNLAPAESNSLSKNAAAFNAAYSNAFASGGTLAQIQAANPFFVAPAFTSPASIIHSPQYQKWSLQAQQRFGSSTSLTVGYIGYHGIHGFFGNPNANAWGFGSYPAGLCSSPPVPPCADPRFGVVQELETSAISNYHGMVASFEHRFTGWGNGFFQANYTYSHALDEVSNGGIGNFTYGSNQSPLDPRNLRESYGPADYDVRHSLNANYVWELPLKEVLRGHGRDSVVKGWQVSGTILARTGFPYTVFDPGEQGKLSGQNFGGPIYAVPVAPLPSAGPCGKRASYTSPTVPCLPPQFLGDGSPSPGALFVQTGCETGFNTGNLPGPLGPCSGPSVTFAQRRNRYRSASYVDTDFALVKNTKIPRWENGVLTIGVQVFNLFNHANFGLPDPQITDAGFGQTFYLEQPPTSILGSGLNANVSQRMIQLRGQIRF